MKAAIRLEHDPPPSKATETLTRGGRSPFPRSRAEEALVGSAFNRLRVNVATSRAQCRVVLVCTPRLLDADCKTVEQMRLVNAICRFVELADQA